MQVIRLRGYPVSEHLGTAVKWMTLRGRTRGQDPKFRKALQMSELLRVVVQADLEELYWIQPTRSEAWVESVYRDVIFAFQTSDLRALEGLLSELDAAPMEHRASAEFLKKLTDVRLAIRKRALLPELLEALESTKATSEIWEGERAFVLAMAHENRSELPQARDRYLRASELLTKARVHRKALKALMNHVAIESWIDPDDKRLIADFSQVLGRALRLRDRAIAGIAILNISWEWERLGALEVALRYARHAVRFLERDFGSLNFHHGLVHRAHLYYRMGRLPEMEADLTLAESSKSAEIQSALRFLRTLANEKPTRILLEEFQKDPQLTPAWQERLSWQLNPEKLSGDRLLSSLESKLISLVSLKPRTSRELLSQLYGGEVGAESARQRLDQLLLRLRKKVPGIVFLREGHYHLHDVPPVLMDTEIDAKAA